MVYNWIIDVEAASSTFFFDRQTKTSSFSFFHILPTDSERLFLNDAIHRSSLKLICFQTFRKPPTSSRRMLSQWRHSASRARKPPRRACSLQKINRLTGVSFGSLCPHTQRCKYSKLPGQGMCQLKIAQDLLAPHCSLTSNCSALPDPETCWHHLSAHVKSVHRTCRTWVFSMNLSSDLKLSGQNDGQNALPLRNPFPAPPKKLPVSDSIPL